MILKILLNLTVSICFGCLLLTNVEAQTICIYGSDHFDGYNDGYYYELLNSGSGTVCMTLNSGAAFSCEWDTTGEMLCRRGVLFDTPVPHQDTGEIFIDYGCNLQLEGTAFIAVYGWAINPLTEYFIVENWGAWRPPGVTQKGQFSVDGGTYDIYEVQRIGGINTYKTYWSVRTSKRTHGTISVSAHFRMWESIGMSVGKLEAVTLALKGYQNRGYADVYRLIMTIPVFDYSEITAPFEYDGEGTFKWKTASIPQYIVSWALDNLTVNGVDFTNTWAGVGNLPEKQGGYYYIDYSSSCPWGHFAIR